MRSNMKNYLGMIAIAIVLVLALGAIGVRIDRDQEKQPPPPIDATPAISGNAPAGLVDAFWLEQYRSQVDYIFDLSDPRQYEAGHIPGSVHLWWQDAMSIPSENYGETYPISNQLPPDYLFNYISINTPQNARIILYDTNNSERASWLMWVMQANGWKDVHVLDGGLAAWIGAGGEVTTDVVDNRDDTLIATPTWDLTHQIRREELNESLQNPNIRIVDTRSADELLDTVNGTIREGHIPGSINIPTAEVMRADGTFKSPEELREIFESHGLSTENDVVVYSLFSSQSGNVWLALQLAGYDNAVIYIDGFVGWSRDQSLPVETEPYATREAATPPASTPQPSRTPIASPDSAPDSTPTNDGPTDLTGL